MNRDQLIDYIAAIPDLTSHRFVDADGQLSVKIHEPREVAELVVNALVDRDYELHRRGSMYNTQEIIDAYNAGFQEGQRFR
jgi:hypothetical protein